MDHEKTPANPMHDGSLCAADATWALSHRCVGLSGHQFAWFDARRRTRHASDGEPVALMGSAAAVAGPNRDHWARSVAPNGGLRLRRTLLAHGNFVAIGGSNWKWRFREGGWLCGHPPANLSRVAISLITPRLTGNPRRKPGIGFGERSKLTREFSCLCCRFPTREKGNYSYTNREFVQCCRERRRLN